MKGLLIAGALFILNASNAAGQSAIPTQDGSNQAYQRALDQSIATEQAGDLTGARDQLEILLRVGADAVPPVVRAEVVERLVSLDARMKASNGPMRQFAARYLFFVSNTVLWILAASIALLTLRTVIRQFPRKSSTAVFFEDLTRRPDERLEGSLVLTRSVLNQLQNPMPVHISTLEMDMMPGSQEPGFLGIQSTLDTAPIDGFKIADRPMKIAGVEFSVRDLAAMVSRLMARPHSANLTGWFSESDDGVVAYAELTDSSTKRTWRIHSPGKGSRANAIDILSSQILVDTDKSTLTRSWQSLRAFRQAIKLRQAPGRSWLADLARARDYLEESVTLDSSNWIARFNLALTLSRGGQPEIALRHFELLEGVIQLAWRSNQHPEESCSSEPAFMDVKHHLHEYPECLFLILYNKAMALAASLDVDGRRKALQELERLSDPSLEHAYSTFSPYDQIAKRLDSRARIELRLYALAAQATVLAGPSDSRTSKSDTHPTIASRIEVLLRDIEVLCASSQEQHWRSLQTARAVALAASARVDGLEGRALLARERLEAAIAAEPRFLEAYLLLAEHYMELSATSADDWEQRAELLLKRALDINPACAQAMALLTRLRPQQTAARTPASGSPAPA